jgi:DNA-binding CsgD family transcriptional regulator
MGFTLKKSAVLTPKNMSGFPEILIPAKLQRAARRYSLTRRELQVLYLLSRGETFKGTGDRLQISARTVEFHARNFRSKIHAANCLAAFCQLTS